MSIAFATAPPDQPLVPLGSYHVGGVKVSAVNRDTAVERFYELIKEEHGGYVTVTSAHGVVEAQTDRILRDIIDRAALTLPDGMPVYLAGRLLHEPAVRRVPGDDFFSAVFADPRAGSIRHFFYGSQESTTRNVVARAAAELGPDAVAGSHCPPIRPVGAREDKEVIERIRATNPDVVWVGLSTPKQEYWMANHATELPGVVLVGVGAVFDFYAGVKERGPRLMSDMGLEWLYRMVSEPKRLAKRYRIVVPRMLGILTVEAARAALRRSGKLV